MDLRASLSLLRTKLISIPRLHCDPLASQVTSSTKLPLSCRTVSLKVSGKVFQTAPPGTLRHYSELSKNSWTNTLGNIGLDDRLEPFTFPHTLEYDRHTQDGNFPSFQKTDPIFLPTGPSRGTNSWVIESRNLWDHQLKFPPVPTWLSVPSHSLHSPGFSWPSTATTICPF